ncbi:hypothetical protein HanPI659440_Chr09g0337251 [Helianthus annuus]|nr:hypothetical protein HanPI659440_Chr09g0337251 [Helianthus annuus]
MSSIIVYCVFSLHDMAYTEEHAFSFPRQFPIAERIFGPIMIARISGVLSIPLLTTYPYIALLTGFMLTFTLNLASIVKNVLSVSFYMKIDCIDRLPNQYGCKQIKRSANSS